MTTSYSLDYLDNVTDITSYVTPHTTTNGSYFTSVDNNTVLEVQSLSPIDALTAENPSTSEDGLTFTSSISPPSTDYLQTTLTFDADVSPITDDFLPSTTETFLTFQSFPSSGSKTESEHAYSKTQDVSSGTTAFETAVISSTTLLISNGAGHTSTTPATTKPTSPEPSLSTTQEGPSPTTLATTINPTDDPKSQTKVSSTSQRNTQTTQTTAYIKTEFTSNTSIADSSSISDPFDGRGLAPALGSLAAILILAVIIILLVFWWKSREKKLRRTLMKLRSISQQTHATGDDPPDICLDVNSFALSQVFCGIDDKQAKPDVASHAFKRMLSAHEDGLNFSRERETDRPISMGQLNIRYGSSDHCSQIQDSRRIQSTHDLSACQGSFSEGDLVKVIRNLDSSSAV